MDLESPPYRVSDYLTPAQRLEILDWHITDAMRDARICGPAQQIRAKVYSTFCANGVCSIGPIDLEVYTASAILDYVQQLGYRLDDEGEWWQGAVYTLRNGGDCEDLSVVTVAMMRCAGLDAALFWVTQRGAPLNHVTAAVRINGRDLWADSSVRGAYLGENPLAAARRTQQSSHLGLQD